MTELFFDFQRFILLHLPVAVIVTYLATLLFRFLGNRAPVIKGLFCINILVCASANFLWFIYSLTTEGSDIAIIKRATGSYAWAYWMMLLCSTFLPFLLLFKQISSSWIALAILPWLMQIGRHFEYIVIVTTNFQRDYQPAEYWEMLILIVSSSIQWLIVGTSLGACYLGVAALFSSLIKLKTNRFQ